MTALNMIFRDIRYMDVAFKRFCDGRKFWRFNGSLGATIWNLKVQYGDSTFALGLHVGAVSASLFIACCVADYHRSLVMSDQGVALPPSENSGSSIECGVGKSMAQAAELPSVKISQVETVYDSISSLKVNDIK